VSYSNPDNILKACIHASDFCREMYSNLLGCVLAGVVVELRIELLLID